MIAFHYPPYQGSSGIQRTLKFARYLPRHEFQPIILTASPRAYRHIDDTQVRDIPANVLVKRAFALDAARHLALRGIYLRFLALPDPWVTWWLGAVPAGLQMIRQYRPEVIWSTYPIATAHLIGLTLCRLTGIPWIADFRDSMTEDNYPADVLTRRTYRWIERQVIRYSSRLIFTAPSTIDMYLNRYSLLSRDRCLLIPNGYDEEDFKNLILSTALERTQDHPIRLVHAGLIYPEERNPRCFFEALSKLKSDGLINSKDLSIVLRASGSENYYLAIVRKLGIDDLINLLPALSYQQALQECADADALLLFQGASCNHQIPAKVYEYLRLRKPILGLTPPGGDTGKLLAETGGASIVDLDDEDGICKVIPEFLAAVRTHSHCIPNAEQVLRYSRGYQTGKLADGLRKLLLEKQNRVAE